MCGREGEDQDGEGGRRRVPCKRATEIEVGAEWTRARNEITGNTRMEEKMKV